MKIIKSNRAISFIVLFFMVFQSNSLVRAQEPATLTEYVVRHQAVTVSIRINSIRAFGRNYEKLLNYRNIYIQYDYSEMKVCNYPNQFDFVNSTCNRLSDRKARRFKERWKLLPETGLQPRFAEYLNKHIMKIGMIAENKTSGSGAKLAVRVVMEEPHAHKDTDRAKPYVYAFCTFYDEKGDTLMCYELTAFAPRGDSVFESLEDSYAVAGKILGEMIIKGTKRREKPIRTRDH